MERDNNDDTDNYNAHLSAAHIEKVMFTELSAWLELLQQYS